MKKILLLFAFGIFSMGALFAQNYNINASFKSTKDGKIYHFDFTNKVYLRYNPTSNQIEGTFSLTSEVSNWNAIMGTDKPTAVFQSPSGDFVYFLDTDHNKYWKLQWSNWEMVSGYPGDLDNFFTPDWDSNWDEDGPYKAQGALYNSANNKIYLFDFTNNKTIAIKWTGGDWSETYDLNTFGDDYTKIERTATFARSAYTNGGYKFALVNNSVLSYIEYSSSHWVGPKPLTDFGNWSKNWNGVPTFINPVGCTSYSLQGYEGNKLFPFIAHNMPSGTLGDDYRVKSVEIHITDDNNQQLLAYLHAPNAFDSPTEIFLTGDASGENIGENCENPTVFSDFAADNLSEGTAPYTSQDFLPEEAFSSLPASATGNGIWYLDIHSQYTNTNNLFRRFSVQLEPKKELQCGVSTSYTVDPGIGAWDMTSFCTASNGNGKEAFYRFTPDKDGEHFISTEGGSGYGDYFIKPADEEFNPNNWACAVSASASDLSIGELTAGKTYYILVKAEETTGTGETFRILCPTCNPPTNLANNDGGYTSLGFSWTASSSSSNYVWQLKAGAMAIGSGSVNDNSYDAYGLQPGTEYTFQVRTDCGNDFYSDIATITVSTPDCPVPTNLTATDITSTSFTVSATTSTITKKWQVVPTGNGMNNDIVAQGETNSNTYVITGLTPSASYDFYIQSKCGEEYSDPASLTNISTLVGVETLSNIKGIAFFPNPAQDELNIAINGAKAADINISVVSILGNVVINKGIKLTSGQNQEVLDISNLVSGTYIVKITDKGKIASFRFVKE